MCKLLYTALVVLVFAAGTCAAVRCYKCETTRKGDSCATGPTTAHEGTESCKECFKLESGEKENSYLVRRGCSETCTEHANMQVSSINVRQFCCRDKDLCNSAAVTRATLLGTVGLVIITIILSV